MLTFPRLKLRVRAPSPAAPSIRRAVTSHCHAAPALPTREYQRDHRRLSLLSISTCTLPIDKSFHITLFIEPPSASTTMRELRRSNYWFQVSHPRPNLRALLSSCRAATLSLGDGETSDERSEAVPPDPFFLTTRHRPAEFHGREPFAEGVKPTCSVAQASATKESGGLESRQLGHEPGESLDPGGVEPARQLR